MVDADKRRPISGQIAQIWPSASFRGFCYLPFFPFPYFVTRAGSDRANPLIFRKLASKMQVFSSLDRSFHPPKCPSKAWLILSAAVCPLPSGAPAPSSVRQGRLHAGRIKIRCGPLALNGNWRLLPLANDEVYLMAPLVTPIVDLPDL